MRTCLAGFSVPWRPKWPWTFILSMLLNGFLGPHAVHAEAPVEGDRELLGLLRAAQATNQALFQRGSLIAHIEANWRTVTDGREARRTQTADVTLLWEGERTYYEYTHHGTQSDKEHSTSQAGRVLDLPDRRVWYNPQVGLAQIYLDKERDSPWLVHVRPDQVWFRYFIPDGPTWGEILDPPDTSNARFVVRREGPDQVIAESYGRKSADNSQQFGIRLVASLSQGGNIIAYEDLAPPGETPSWDKGEYEWVADGRGNWRLKRLVRTVIDVRGDNRGELEYVMDVSDYNPDPVIARNRFETESLRFAPGTVVEESGGGRERSYEVGAGSAESKRLSEDVLNNLAERLRSAEFAAPKSNESLKTNQ